MPKLFQKFLFIGGRFGAKLRTVNLVGGIAPPRITMKDADGSEIYERVQLAVDSQKVTVYYYSQVAHDDRWQTLLSMIVKQDVRAIVKECAATNPNGTKVKPLVLFNGRIVAGYPAHGYIAARTKAEAMRLAQAAGYNLSPNELRNYWVEGHWGVDTLASLGSPSEPCFWILNEREHVFTRQDKKQKKVKLRRVKLW